MTGGPDGCGRRLRARSLAFHLPAVVSLGVIASIITTAILLSVRKRRRVAGRRSYR
ncbi:MAG: hypothetical protein ACM3ML_15915 [Micromonosporaceae bacterium]